MNEMNTASWYKKCADDLKCSVFDVLMQSGIPHFPLAEVKKFKRLLTPGQTLVIVKILDESEQLYTQKADESFKDKDFSRAAWLAGCAQAMNERAAQWHQLIEARRRGPTPVAGDEAIIEQGAEASDTRPAPEPVS